jgi:hypothetical protein
VKYRTDANCDTALASNWTSLGTISSSGETEYTFASGVGAAFKRIQFRFELARAAGTASETPDVQYWVLPYKKVSPKTKRWEYTFTADCTKDYDDKSPEQMMEALQAAAETETLLAFIIKDTTYYVEVIGVEAEELTGEGDRGFYQVKVRPL